MKPFIFPLFGTLILSACASTTPTLEEKLAGRSPTERATILKQECDDEADWRMLSRPGNQSAHIKRSETICAGYDKELRSTLGEQSKPPAE